MSLEHKWPIGTNHFPCTFFLSVCVFVCVSLSVELWKIWLSRSRCHLGWWVGWIHRH